MSSLESNRPDTQLEELLRRAEAQQQEAEDYSEEDDELEDISEEDYTSQLETEEEEDEDADDSSEDDFDEDYDEEEELDESFDYDDEDDEEDKSDNDSLPPSSSVRQKTKGLLAYELSDKQLADLKKIPRHRWIFFVFLAVLILLSAHWNTFYNTELRTVSEQEKVLKSLRFRSLFMTAELVRIERINSIEERIRELNLPLEHSTQPPYQIVDTLQRQ